MCSSFYALENFSAIHSSVFALRSHCNLDPGSGPDPGSDFDVSLTLLALKSVTRLRTFFHKIFDMSLLKSLEFTD